MENVAEDDFGDGVNRRVFEIELVALTAAGCRHRRGRFDRRAAVIARRALAAGSGVRAFRRRGKARLQVGLANAIHRIGRRGAAFPARREIACREQRAADSNARARQQGADRRPPCKPAHYEQLTHPKRSLSLQPPPTRLLIDRVFEHR
jgi:hypothetical protein